MNHSHTTWYVHHELHTPNTHSIIAKTKCNDTIHAEHIINQYRQQLPNVGRRITAITNQGTSIKHNTIDGHIHHIHMIPTQHTP